MVEKRKNKNLTKKDTVVLINKAFNSLDKAIDSLIGGAEELKLDLLIDLFKLSKKMSGVYREAHLAILKRGK